jgi:Asp-tRNA(Asn)/Glu-tRNA(Gln) amidotransferase B subunit
MVVGAQSGFLCLFFNFDYKKMNYSYLEDDEDKSNINNSAKTFLNDYEILKLSLNDYKNNLKDLMKQKETYEIYMKSLLNNHLDIVNIVNNNNLNNSFTEYQTNIKDNYDKWINNHYEIKLKSFEENIEIIELKLKDFSNLFTYIINNIIGDKQISKNMCPICFENEIDICINPCGHTTCNKCIISNRTNIYNNKCFTCRGNVNDYIKIYFSL